MKRTLLMIVTLLILNTGCTQKSSFFSEDLEELSAVMHTKKGELYSSLEIKATIVATYLNASSPEYKNSKDEMFLVSIFIDDDSSDPKNHGIYNKAYTLTLNGIEAKSIKKLAFEDDLIKVAPIRNRWSTYYLVGFESKESDELKLTFKNDAYGAEVLGYSKAY